MKKTLIIGNKSFTPMQNVFIIAEAGVNHNGDEKLAKKLIRKAKECGADCIKFQTFKAENVASANAPKASYQLETTNPKESQIEMLDKLELPIESYGELLKFSKDQGIIFLSTPYNEEDIDFLDELQVPAFKLASMHAVEPNIIKHVAKKGKPLILSTGMATLGEVDEAVKSFREVGNEQLVLLQCTTNYPSREEDCNLLAMQTMRNAFDILIGYSDHTQNDTACIMSVALGATVIEKHFTLDKNLPGPDQSTSYEPKEFSRLVDGIRNAEKVLGSARKVPCEIEKINAVGMRRSIVAKENIPAGVDITEKIITLKRPATGLSPKFFDYVVGKKTKKEILADSQIKFSDLE